RGNEIEEHTFSQIFKIENLDKKVRDAVEKNNAVDVQVLLYNTLANVLTSNIEFDDKLTEASVLSEINLINPNRGVVERGGRIIAKGEIVEGDKYQILQSLKAEYQSQILGSTSLIWMIVGYT